MFFLENQIQEQTKMSKAIENLAAAQQKAMSMRPKVGGFPHLAEVLRQAGVKKNIWTLPSCQSVYVTELGNVVSVMSSLVEGMDAIPIFDQDALIKTIRSDQAGESTFIEFLQGSWNAGVINYDVDFELRTVIYRGIGGEEYVEKYPAVEI